MNRIRRIFVNEQGQLRIGWRLTVGAAAGFGTLFGVELFLGFVFGRLFEAWALTNDNLIYAPFFAQQIVFWHADFTYMIACAASILVGILLAKRWTQPAANDAGMISFGALAGIGCGALLTAVSLAFDSMRLEWPLGEASFSPSLISGIVVLLLGCLCDEVLGKRLIFDPLRQRFGRLAGYVAMGIWVVFANPTPLGMLNSVLLGLLGCVIYERGGIFASAALQAGWMIWTNLVFAWPNSGSACLYRMYTVSDAWLTGGNAGAEGGLGCTIVWTILAVVLIRKELKRGINGILKGRKTDG